jgi:LmbE family N-acetylglucosaminyl deacetylase
MSGSGSSSVARNPSARLTLLHLAPHPDDEVMGGPAIMLALQASGHRIINLACSLGRSGDRERREAEARESAERSGFELIVASPPVSMSSDDDLDKAQRELGPLIARVVRSEAVDIVFSPSPHDRHPGHEMVGRTTLAALSGLEEGAPAWWMWSLWGELPFPTLIAHFGPERLREVVRALEAYGGELRRNDYRRLVRGRAEANAVLGPERVFGFGARGGGSEFAELATEVVRRGDEWLLGSPRELDPGDPLAEPTSKPISGWLEAPSLTQRFGPPGT